MQTFKDSSGKDWTIELTIGVAKKIKSLVGVDFIETDPQQLVDLLFTSPLKRIDCLSLMLRGSETQEFEDVLEGATFRAANSAFWDELLFFIRSLRPEIAMVMQATMEKATILYQRQAEMIEELANDPKVTARMEEELKKVKATAMSQLDSLIGNTSTNSPE